MTEPSLTNPFRQQLGLAQAAARAARDAADAKVAAARRRYEQIRAAA